MSARPPWREFKNALTAIGFRPSRRLGQNFLLDENMVQRIALDTELRAGDRALEVGCGCGFLTAEIAARGAQVVAVEIDPRLVEIAARFLQPFEQQVELVGGDVLSGKHALSPAVTRVLDRWSGADWHAVGNLPYSVASPLLVVLARLAEPPRSITVLVQKEVGERMAAAPGTRARGTLSVRLEPVYRARVLRSVPPQLFWPRPKVDSAVVRLDLLPERPSRAEVARLDALVASLFSGRRKALRGLVARALGIPAGAGALLERLGLDPLARPEDLTAAEWQALSTSAEWIEGSRDERR